MQCTQVAKSQVGVSGIDWERARGRGRGWSIGFDWARAERAFLGGVFGPSCAGLALDWTGSSGEQRGGVEEISKE